MEYIIVYYSNQWYSNNSDALKNIRNIDQLFEAFHYVLLFDPIKNVIRKIKKFGYYIYGTLYNSVLYCFFTTKYKDDDEITLFFNKFISDILPDSVPLQIENKEITTTLDSIYKTSKNIDKNRYDKKVSLDTEYQTKLLVNSYIRRNIEKKYIFEKLNNYDILKNNNLIKMESGQRSNSSDGLNKDIKKSEITNIDKINESCNNINENDIDINKNTNKVLSKNAKRIDTYDDNLEDLSDDEKNNINFPNIAMILVCFFFLIFILIINLK